MSSHILAEVAQTVDSVVILNHGHLVTQSSLPELTAGGTIGLEQAFLKLTSGPGGSDGQGGPPGQRIRPTQEMSR